MKSILITGAAKRVGRGLALGFAEQGWHVLAHYNTSGDDARTLGRDIAATGGSVTLVSADLNTAAGARDLIARCVSGGRIDCVINSASVFDYDFPGDHDDDIWRDSLNVNLHAPVIIAEEFFNFAKAQGTEGCIINMLDNKVFALNPDYFSYTVAKAGLLAATQMLAMGFAPLVRVCGIAPGITLVSGDQSAENFTATHAINPLNTGCTIDDIVGGALFIAGGTYATGQVLTIDGGQTLMHLPRDVAYLEGSK